MNWQNRHLSDISDIYRAYNGHSLMFITWRLFGECTVLQRGAKEATKGCQRGKKPQEKRTKVQNKKIKSTNEPKNKNNKSRKPKFTIQTSRMMETGKCEIFSGSSVPQDKRF